MDAFIARKISAQNFLGGYFLEIFLERFCDSMYTGKHEAISISRVMRYFGVGISTTYFKMAWGRKVTVSV